MYKLVFFGTSDFSVPSLEALLDDPRFQIQAVVTKPDAPIGRHQILTPPEIKIMAEKNRIPVFQFQKMKVPETYETLKNLGGIDAYVVVSYGKIIPQNILDLPKHGCINVHGSLLPRWRGASCVQAAIAAGDEESGVTIMKLDALMDHGPILAQKTTSISDDETGGSLHDRLATLGAQTLPDVLWNFLEGGIDPVEQDHSKATECKLLSREDGKLDFARSAAEIERLIRAYNPWPGTWIEWNGKRLKIIKATPSEARFNTQNSKFDLFIDNDNLYLTCGDSPLQIMELQPEGSKPMSAQAFIAGYGKNIQTI